MNEKGDEGWVERLFTRQRAEEARTLARAKREQHAEGKEPFDLDRFEELYDTSTASGTLPPRELRLRTYEHRYYRQHPEIRTLEALAELMRELDPWR